MTLPTLQGATVNSIASALSIFYAVYLGILQKAERRLDLDERESLKSGDVYVWEERDFQTEGSEGIERWTDGIKWGSSRVRNEFLFYYERDFDPNEPQAVQDTRLIKQTYSVFLQAPGDPRNRTRKWHMVAYYSQLTVESLRKVEEIPHLAALQVPDAFFRPARVKRGQGRRRGSGSDPPSSPPATTIRRSASAVERQPRRLKSNTPPRPRSSSGGQHSGASHAAPYTRPRPMEPSLMPGAPNANPGPSGGLAMPLSDLHSAYGRSSTPLPRLSELDKPGRTLAPYGPALHTPPLPSGYHAPVMILPLPHVPHGTSLRRSSADYKALDALQKRFMK
ncbi:hypothetical protein FS749_004525 [Ceratobasidium sp. UAMH 11750]|nr:hypothetical protein FS749_004525 [Ceratobasidium sp. UAMH 11750]